MIEIAVRSSYSSRPEEKHRWWFMIIMYDGQHSWPLKPRTTMCKWMRTASLHVAFSIGVEHGFVWRVRVPHSWMADYCCPFNMAILGVYPIFIFSDNWLPCVNSGIAHFTGSNRVEWSAAVMHFPLLRCIERKSVPNLSAENGSENSHLQPACTAFWLSRNCRTAMNSILSL